jgi:hypothetical protein
MPLEIIGVVAILVFTFGMIFLARNFAKNVTSTSDEDIETINQLQATGGRARPRLGPHRLKVPPLHQVPGT